jgi:hypothetical protein
MKMPGFTAEAAMRGGVDNYAVRQRSSNNQEVVPQARDAFRCMNKAIRMYDRCVSIGYDSGTCAVTATDFWDFCNAYDL